MTYWYTSSWDALQTDSVSISDDIGNILSEDNHKGFSGHEKRDITYHLSVPEYNEGSTYFLNTKTWAEGDYYSNGQVYMESIPDSEAPQYSTPDTIVLDTSLVLADYREELSASDNCTKVKITQSPAPGSTYSGEQPIVFLLSDSDGNLASVEVPVKVTYDPGTGLGVIELKNRLSVYPNPASNYVTIKADGFIGLRLLDNKGKELMNSDRQRIDLQSYPRGMYYIEVETEYGISTRKIVKN